MTEVKAASGGGKVVRADDGTADVMSHLKKALDVLDRMDAPPELAARVQQALDAVAEYRSSD